MFTNNTIAPLATYDQDCVYTTENLFLRRKFDNIPFTLSNGKTRNFGIVDDLTSSFDLSSIFRDIAQDATKFGNIFTVKQVLRVRNTLMPNVHSSYSIAVGVYVQENKESELTLRYFLLPNIKVLQKNKFTFIPQFTTNAEIETGTYNSAIVDGENYFKHSNEQFQPGLLDIIDSFSYAENSMFDCATQFRDHFGQVFHLIELETSILIVESMLTFNAKMAVW